MNICWHCLLKLRYYFLFSTLGVLIYFLTSWSSHTLSKFYFQFTWPFISSPTFSASSPCSPIRLPKGWHTPFCSLTASRHGSLIAGRLVWAFTPSSWAGASRSLQDFLMLKPGTGPVLPHIVGQSKSRGCPISKEKQIRLHCGMEGAVATLRSTRSKKKKRTRNIVTITQSHLSLFQIHLLDIFTMLLFL